MKPSWYQMTQDAELEALQTDVMRFMAILGLCLAAIFSLVQGAEREPVAPAPADEVAPTKVPTPPTLPSPARSDLVPAAPTALEKAVSGRPKNLVAEIIVATNSVPKPVPVITRGAAPEHRFESRAEPDPEPDPVEAPLPTPVAAEQPGFSLEFASASVLLKLHNSGQLQLFAQVQGQFWTLDATGAFLPASAPASYYRMQSATVPAHLPILLEQATGQAVAEWGVQLAPALVEQLQRIMRERAGGELVIQADGRVAVAQENRGISG